MSDTLRCQCGSIDFTGEDESRAYETPRAFHWLDKPCEAKPQPPTTQAELRAALSAARELSEARYVEACNQAQRAVEMEAERDAALAAARSERDDAKATFLRAIEGQRESFERTRPLCSGHVDKMQGTCLGCRIDRLERERDAARSEVEALRGALEEADVRAMAEIQRRAHVEEPEGQTIRQLNTSVRVLREEIHEQRIRAQAAESERDSLAERLDAALARLHETREATGRASKAWAAWVKHRDHDCPGLTNGDPCDDYSDNCGGEAIWEELEAAFGALTPSPSTTPPHYWLSHEQMLARWPSIARDADTYHTSCLWCGVMKRGDGKPQKPCRGRVGISLRASPSTTPETRGEAKKEET